METVFSFPRSFSLRVVGPLHFQKLNLLTTSDTLCEIKNTNGVLSIRKVILEIERFVVDFADGVLEATPELGHMEYIMYSGKVRGKFKLVGNFSTFSKNAKRSDVTWGQLAFDTETLGSLQRSNPKVSLLIQIVALLPMMTIRVAFLTRLGCFQFLTNNANLLFCILNHVRSKELSFTGF